jgi:hypothetical protein
MGSTVCLGDEMRERVQKIHGMPVGRQRRQEKSGSLGFARDDITMDADPFKTGKKPQGCADSALRYRWNGETGSTVLFAEDGRRRSFLQRLKPGLWRFFTRGLEAPAS